MEYIVVHFGVLLQALFANRNIQRWSAPSGNYGFFFQDTKPILLRKIVRDFFDSRPPQLYSEENGLRTRSMTMAILHHVRAVTGMKSSMVWFTCSLHLAEANPKYMYSTFHIQTWIWGICSLPWYKNSFRCKSGTSIQTSLQITDSCSFCHP